LAQEQGSKLLDKISRPILALNKVSVPYHHRLAPIIFCP
jgi:hypothetical protein